MLKDMGLSFGKSILYSVLSQVHLESGELESAQSCAEKALNIAQENKQRFGEGRSLIVYGRILGKKESTQIDKTEGFILKGTQILGELSIQPYVSIGNLWLGELNADEGQKEKALEYLKTAETMFQEMGVDYWLSRTQEVLKRV